MSPSFFERLTGGHSIDEYDSPDKENGSDDFDDGKDEGTSTETEEEGQLMIDAYQTSTHVVVHAFVAGVRVEDLDVSATREVLTIVGKRRDVSQIGDSDYFHKELYWGNFSRTVLMPDEIDPEDYDVSLKNGVLTIKLAKLDKERVQKFKIKTG